jgi:excisionase family DNA binding protein
MTLAGRVHAEGARVSVGTEMNERGPNAGNPYVSTVQVAAALGVGITTVKRWVDQGILPAQKTPGGHRKILLSDVVRVVREGDFPRLDLSRLGLSPVGQESPDPTSLSAAMLAALKRGEAETLRSLLQGAHRSGMAIETLADAVVAPAMRRAGWTSGRSTRAPNSARPPSTRSAPRSRAPPTARSRWPSAAARKETRTCWRISSRRWC